MFEIGTHVRSAIAMTGLSLALAMGVAAPANAALIDFTDTAAFPASITGQTSLSGSVNLDGADVGFTVYANPKFKETTGTINPGACAANPLACDRDGLGVGNDDELGGDETVRIVFDTAVWVETFYVLDLFWTKGRNGESVAPYEVGAYTLDDGFFGTFDAARSETVNTSDIGYLAFNLGRAVTSIEWSYNGGNDTAGIGDYAVAGLSVAHTPLPATAWFMLTSLGGLIGFRWLRKDKNTATN
jgi:hypothetical protein